MIMRVPGLPELPQILHAAICIDGAFAGDIQLLSRPDTLKIVASEGLRPAFLQSFVEVKVGQGSACARAFGSARQVVIRDVQADPSFAPYRDIAREAGFRAVQSTPVIDRTNRAVGVLSTHFATPHAPSLSALRLYERLARIVGLLVECDGHCSRVRETGADPESLFEDHSRSVIALIPALLEPPRAESASALVALELEKIIDRMRYLRPS